MQTLLAQLLIVTKMFAVPGWSLSSDLLKTQTSAHVVAESSGAANTSKKRKRGNDKKKKKKVEASEPGANTPKVPARSEKRRKKESAAIAITNASGLDDALVTGPHGGSRTNDSTLDIRQNKNKTTALESKKRERKSKPEVSGERATVEAEAGNATQPPALSSAKLTPLQAAMRQKLISARFRHLNQTLYTTPSQEASSLFQSNPSFFDEYHAGFRQQVSAWPENPVEGFLTELFRRGKIQPCIYGKKRNPNQMVLQNDKKASEQPLPRNSGTCVVADLGCGDATLGARVNKFGSKLKIKVLSYDLYSTNSAVIKADIAKLPLESGSINLAIFCLALMGTNWIDFIEEAWRTLHWKGELWIAEIKSRFGRPKQTRVDHSVGKKRKFERDTKHAVDGDVQLVDEMDPVPTESKTDVSAFVDVLRRRGFALHDDEESIDLSNKMFVTMKFTKRLRPIKGKGMAAQSEEGQSMMERPNVSDGRDADIDVDAEASVLKPCLYKIR